MNGAVITDGLLRPTDPFNSANPLSFADGSGGIAALTFPVSVGDVVNLEIFRTPPEVTTFVGVNLTITMAQTCVQPPAGLMAWWPGDGNANDIIDGNDGTLQNSATFASGKVGQAFSFDGVDDRISGSTVTGFPLGSSPRTITAWIKSTSTSTLDRNIFHYGVSNANLPPTNFHLFIRGATGRIGVGNGFGFGTVDGTTFVDDGNFHFVVGVYEGPGTNIARIYVDGVQEASAVITTPGTLSGAWRIGQFLDPFPGAGFQGLIDEVDIYNLALSAAEIQAIFNAGSAGKCKLAPPETL